MIQFKSVLLLLLSIIIGALFIYSGYTKLYTLSSFETFEFSIIEYLHFPWWMATLSSRLLTGLELALGTLIILHFYGNLKWILKLAAGLLIVFSLYLVYLWIVAGNNINCGCFGDAVWMSPGSSLVKNVLLLGGIGLLIRFQSSIHLRWAQPGSLLLLLAISTIPFFLYSIPDKQPQWLQKEHYRINLSALYKAGKNSPQIDLYKGKHIIAYFSLGCPHCQLAGYKIHLMKEKNPSLPFYMVLSGQDENWQPFWEKTKAHNIPYTRISSEDFIAVAGYSWPAIFWVKDGWVEAKTNYMQLDQGEIEKWLSAE